MSRIKIVLLGAAIGLGIKISTDKRFAREFVHNVIVHPAMMLLPSNAATLMHDRNADWAFSQERHDELAIEQGQPA
jgi:hypothetical protein